MKVFYTTATKHLRIKLHFDDGNATITRFGDGEIFVRVEDDVYKKPVWVIAATPTGAENYIELFLLLDALNRLHAQINLLITYFGYARQDRAQKGEACGAQIFSEFFETFKFNKIIVIHAHSARLHSYLHFENFIPYELFYSLAKQADVILAPDMGARELAKKISAECKRSLAVAEKVRTADQIEICKILGDVKNKKVLIVDDIIATGSTVIKVSNILKQLGASSIKVMATHAIFTGNSEAQLDESDIEKVYVTNTLSKIFVTKKIEVIDMSEIIKKIIEKGVL